MKKSTYILYLVVAIALSGCGDMTQRIEIDCWGGSNGVVECTITFKGDLVVSSNSVIDASLARINLSQSSMSLNSTSGTFSIVVKDSTKALVASDVFNWYKVGSYLLPANPAQVSQWINSHVQAGDTVSLELSGVEMDGQPGNNTAVAVLEYGGFSSGASASYYLNEADLNGF